jgi:hypothetical protein
VSELVERLSQGIHSVEIALRPERSPHILKECIERGYVHVKFTDTRGGTEVGVRIDENMAQCALADVSRGESTIRVSGTLVLDYIPVRCVVDINLETYNGTGCLQVVQ